MAEPKGMHKQAAVIPPLELQPQLNVSPSANPPVGTVQCDSSQDTLPQASRWQNVAPQFASSHDNFPQDASPSEGAADGAAVAPEPKLRDEETFEKFLCRNQIHTILGYFKRYFAPSHDTSSECSAATWFSALEGATDLEPKLRDEETFEKFLCRNQLHTTLGYFKRRLDALMFYPWVLQSDERGRECIGRNIGRWVVITLLRCWWGALCSFTIGPIAFQASWQDALLAAPMGFTVVLLQRIFSNPSVRSLNSMVFQIVEVIAAFIVSFLGVVFLHNGIIKCYSAFVASSIVLLLPGWLLSCAAFEIASKNTVSGSIRLVWALVYTLLLGLGIRFGSQLASGGFYHGDFTLPPIVTVRTDPPFNSTLLFPVNGIFCSTNQSTDEGLFPKCPIWRNQIFPLIYLISLAFKLHQADLFDTYDWARAYFGKCPKSCRSLAWCIRERHRMTTRALSRLLDLTIMFAIGWGSHRAAYYVENLNATFAGRPEFAIAFASVIIGCSSLLYDVMRSIIYRHHKGRAFLVALVPLLFTVPSGFGVIVSFAYNANEIDNTDALSSILINVEQLVVVPIAIVVGVAGGRVAGNIIAIAFCSVFLGLGGRLMRRAGFIAPDSAAVARSASSAALPGPRVRTQTNDEDKEGNAGNHGNADNPEKKANPIIYRAVPPTDVFLQLWPETDYLNEVLNPGLMSL